MLITAIIYCLLVASVFCGSVHGPVIILNTTLVLTLYIQSNHHLWNTSTSIYAAITSFQVLIIRVLYSVGT